MDNSNLRCKFCDENFDNDEHAPRILFTCGHSICTNCLKAQIDNKDYFHCKEDNVRISLLNTTIDSFPANKALLDVLRTSQPKSMLLTNTLESRNSITSNTTGRRVAGMRKGLSEKKLSHLDAISLNSERRTVNGRHRTEIAETITLARSFSRNTKTNNSQDSLSEESRIDPSELCTEHGKRLEAVCESPTCQTRVCLECGLFGSHSKHPVKKQADFLAETKELSIKLFTLFGDIKKQEENVSGKSLKKKTINAISTKKIEIEKEIKRAFDVN